MREIAVFDGAGPEARDQYGRRLYRSYALVNFFAADDAAALDLMERAERALAELVPDDSAYIDAVFTDEVYVGETDEPWTPPEPVTESREQAR